jgi:hypothetical protein
VLNWLWLALAQQRQGKAEEARLAGQGDRMAR